MSDDGKRDSAAADGRSTEEEERPGAGSDASIAHAATLASDSAVDTAGETGKGGRGDSAAPERLGRFVLREHLGSGAMGAVYRAHDPALHRDVALKVLHLHRKSSGRARFEREARALAKLAHSNVLTVHEVGIVEGDLFIATELVKGQTLRAWLRESKRTWLEIRDVFLAAGRGLAAAHAAGLVHRDFKPDNVMVGKDGRVRVVDFGLARMVEEQDDLEPKDAESIGSHPDLTATGSVLGTPLYMSPEQLVGQAADERSDQFSFCVALYEAVCGCRPFDSTSIHSLRREIAKGPRPAPAECVAPDWALQIVLQGLSRDPEARHVSMDALLELLAADPAASRRRRRRIVAMALAAGALLVIAGATLLRSGSPSSSACQNAETPLAGIWDAGAREAVRAALTGSEKAYADGVAQRVSERIDAYVGEWTSMRVEACEATRVRHEQSDALLDLRMRCLDRRLQQLSSLIDVLMRADDKVLERATNAVAELTPIRVCADQKLLEAAIPPPSDPAVRAEVDAITKEVDRAEALRRAGKYSDGLEIAEAAVKRARAVEYAPIRARALYTQGDIQDWLGKGEEADKSLHEAIEEAARARDDSLLADSWIALVYVLGATEGRPEDAEKLFPAARAAAARVSEDVGTQGDLANNIGGVLASAGKVAEARPELERAVALWEKAFGPEDPKVGAALGNLGIVVAQLGDVEEALTYHERSLRIQEKAFGPTHPRVATVLNGLSNKHSALGHHDRAIEYAQRALEIQQAALPPDSPDLAMAHITLANAYRMAGEKDVAFDHFKTAIEIQERAYPGDHPQKAIAQNNFADVLRARGDCSEAIARYDRALAIFETTLGDEHPLRAFPLNGKASCLFESGDLEGAKQAQTEALKLIEGAHIDAALEAELSFGLARTLWAEGRERSRAIALARAARELYAGGAEGGAANLPVVENWIAERVK